MKCLLRVEQDGGVEGCELTSSQKNPPKSQLLNNHWGDRKEEKEVRGVMGRGSEATEAKLVLILPSDWRWRRSQRPLPSSKEGMGPNFSPSPLPCMEPGTEGYLNICYIIKVG